MPDRPRPTGAGPGPGVTLGAVVAGVVCCATLPLLIGSGVLVVSAGLLRNVALAGAGLLVAAGTLWWVLTRRNPDRAGPACAPDLEADRASKPDRRTSPTGD